MPAFADTVTPKAATPVTLPALWEPEAHNEASCKRCCPKREKPTSFKYLVNISRCRKLVEKVVEDVSENGTTPPGIPASKERNSGSRA